MSDALLALVALLLALLGAAVGGYALARGRGGVAPAAPPQPDTAGERTEAARADVQAEQVEADVEAATQRVEQGQPSGLADVLNRQRHPP